MAMLNNQSVIWLLGWEQLHGFNFQHVWKLIIVAKISEPVQSVSVVGNTTETTLFQKGENSDWPKKIKKESLALIDLMNFANDFWQAAAQKVWPQKTSVQGSWFFGQAWTVRAWEFL